MGQSNPHRKHSEIINKAISVAHCLSYNGDENVAAAKHLLIDLSRRLGRKCVTVKKLPNGLYALDLYGKTRKMTFKQCFLYRVFGVLPVID